MELAASGEPNSLDLSARALCARTVKTVLRDDSVPFPPVFFSFNDEYAARVPIRVCRGMT